MVWQLVGTPSQNEIVAEALAVCSFPFDRLAPQLLSEKGRTSIPVEWADLSTYGASAAEAAAVGDHDHIHEGGDTAHPINDPENRSRVLGLAWYSGKVSIDTSLESNPLLAKEVFLSEGAHMVDFFYMTDEHRAYISSVVHHHDETDHGHGWFDRGTYREWVGEAFMGIFIQAFAPTIPVTIPFTHAATPEGADLAGHALLGPRVFTTPLGRVFHDTHRLRVPSKWFISRQEAMRQGLRPCGTCRP